MLVLGRRVGERVLLMTPSGETIVVTLIRASSMVGRIGFQASDNVRIMREELATQEQLEAAGLSRRDDVRPL